MIRKTWLVWMVVLIGIFLAGAAECRGADAPAKVTEAFWKAVKSGGTKAARAYTTKASQAAIDGGMTMTMKGNFLIGETKIQGNKATVIVKDADKKGEQLATILMREGGKWKVDLMKTLEGMLAVSDVGKQMKEAQEKLLEKVSAAMKDMPIPGANGNMQAAADKMAAAMAKAMAAATSTAKPVEKMFLLPDMGWGDPFLNPRERVRAEIGEKDIIPELGDEKKKIWEDALTELAVEVIIGFEDDLAAIVAGVRVRSGDIISGGKLRFEVKKITRNAVHLRCISEEEKFRKFLGITVKRKIAL